MDLILWLKVSGALLAFVGGIWLGLGLPGLKRGGKEGEIGGRRWTLERTWMNRLMRGRLDRPRRFSTRRLIRPGEKGEPTRQGHGAGRASSRSARVDPETSQSTQGGS